MPDVSATPGELVIRLVSLVGPQLPAGEQWLRGEGPPADSLGQDGQFYLDVSSGSVYVKSGGHWLLTSSNDTGAFGDVYGGMPDSNFEPRNDVYAGSPDTSFGSNNLDGGAP